MDPKVRQNYEGFLNPDVLRPRLIAAALYIAAYESLKESIITHIQTFFWNGFDESGPKYSPEYQTEVLNRNKSVLYASLDWLKNKMNVIDDADIATFERVKHCRNDLSHRLFSLLGSEGLPSDFEDRFADLGALLYKIELWWVVNFEIPINPDFDGKEIDEKEIFPGRVIGLKVLCDIALGDPESSRSYYEEFRKRTNAP
jgi:hypothetical protein